jgi:glycosyltransferase involved in cell wall biosynthesis
MRILISTGIYPPKIGGPSEYSKELKNALEKAQNRVRIATFGIEEYLPTGVRHVFFLLKIVLKILRSDLVISMDTFSVALPTVFVSKVFARKNIIRTGGDFLWEQYIERTKKKVLFKNFYDTEKQNFTLKEKAIFNLTKWTLHNTSFVVFSTEWQREIFINAYGLDKNKTSIIENYYGEKEDRESVSTKYFIGSTRDLVWKNLETLKSVFNDLKNEHREVDLDTSNVKYELFMEKMRKSYAVVLVSLGDISQNMILDAIRINKPFICTKETGIYNRIKDAGIFVDPLNKDEIKNAVIRLIDKDEYELALNKVKKFSFTHSWDEIAGEFLSISKNLK